MKTVFFGSPAAALPSLEALLTAGHTVELVVTQPDKPAGRGRRLVPSAVKTFAAERRITVITPSKIRTDEDARERIVAAGPDVNVVVAYGQIIPHAVHFFPPHHSLNVHFSLLPEYRGAAPVQWTVLNGDAGSGVTIIELNDRMDEGDILAQERISLAPRETALALEARLAGIGARLLVSTLARIDGIPRIKQDDSLATLAPKIRKEDGRVVWSDTAAGIDRRVLALADRPGVFTVFRGKRLNIVRGHPVGTAGPAEALPAAPRPGPSAILAVGKSGLTVACGAGTAYVIEELQPEGKGTMSAHAFSLGTRLFLGDKIGI